VLAPPLRHETPDDIVAIGAVIYYARFGVQVHAGLQLPGVPPGYFMALALHGPVPEGIACYSDAFDIAVTGAGVWALCRSTTG
jgi:predicted N-acetyltransferase YhbS